MRSLNLMMRRGTYNFWRRCRSLKMWAGSSVIVLLDKSLQKTVKTQNGHTGDSGHLSPQLPFPSRYKGRNESRSIRPRTCDSCPWVNRGVFLIPGRPCCMRFIQFLSGISSPLCQHILALGSSINFLSKVHPAHFYHPRSWDSHLATICLSS